MKKWHFFALAGILSTSLVVFSCQKEPVQSATPTTTKHRFTQQEQDLLMRLENINPHQVLDRTAMQTFGADMMGCLGGAVAGSAIPGIGTFWGGVMGAIGTSLQMSAFSNSPGGGGTGLSNSENPFDAAGLHHNRCLEANLDAFNALDPAERTNDLLYSYGETYFTNTTGEDPESLRPLVFPAASEMYDMLRSAGADADIPTVINQLMERGRISPIQAAVTTAYLLQVLSLPDDRYYAASVQFEAEVLNAGIEDSEKNSILAALAVGRYSRGFWGL